MAQDAEVLLQQFGICLDGLLDTQLLQGWASFAAAASNSGWQGSSGGGGQPVAGYMGRMGLGKLYAQYGFSHVSKEFVKQCFDADAR